MVAPEYLNHNNMQIIPTQKYVLLAQQEAETTTSGGIILNPNDEEKPLKGIVEDIGPDCEFINPGQAVVFKKYSGIEIDEYLLIEEKDIIATLA